MTLLSRDYLLLSECEHAKKESHDPDRQVGAVLADADGHILSTGANRPPDAMHFTRDASFQAISDDPNWKYFMLEHAERDAINRARNLGHSLAGATIYSTLFPCADCARAIVASGVRRVVVPAPVLDAQINEKWLNHFKYSRQIFERSNLELEFVEAAIT